MERERLLEDLFVILFLGTPTAAVEAVVLLFLFLFLMMWLILCLLLRFLLLLLLFFLGGGRKFLPIVVPPLPGKEEYDGKDGPDLDLGLGVGST